MGNITTNITTNTSQDGSYNYTYDFNYDYFNDYIFLYNYLTKAGFIMHVATCIIISIGLPLILVAIYSLYSLVRKDHVAPIYVINLLISDLIQLCSLIVMEALLDREMTDTDSLIRDSFSYIHLYGVVVSVGFMVCIALERYLVIACPLWYRCRRTVKISVAVCVFVWAVPLAPILASDLWLDSPVPYIFMGVLLLFPFPLFIFFLVGIFKALSASISVSPDEKRRIVGILVLVLLIYTLLFLPYIIFSFADVDQFTGLIGSLSYLSFMLLKLSPLADLVLYIFMRKGAIDKLLAFLCRCRMDSNDDNRPKV